MYGTIARMKAKPGLGAEAWGMVTKDAEEANIPGVVATYVYQSDNDPNEFFLVAVFKSKEAYRANAQSPAQNERFMKMMTLLAAEPEWHDGAVIYAKS